MATVHDVVKKSPVAKIEVQMIGTERLVGQTEIPVTVHASRTTHGVRIHEEAQAINALPHGAIVRLTASLPIGELVVLTNKKTSLHVICRVQNVKRGSGDQKDFDLEFIEPTPGFWGDFGAAEQAISTEMPRTVHTRSGERAISSQVSPPRTAATRTPIWRQRPAVQDQPYPAAGPIAPFNSRRTEPEPVALSRDEVRRDELERLSRAITHHVNNEEICESQAWAELPIPGETTHQPVGSRIGSLAIVALASIATGALMGAWFYKQTTRANTVGQEAAPQAVTSPIGEPALPASDSPVQALSGTTVVRDVRAALSTAVTQTRTPPRRNTTEQGPSALVAETMIPEAHRSLNSLAIGNLRAPTQKNRPLIVQSSDAPPGLDANRSLGQAAIGIGFLADVGTGPAQPPPSKGGRLEPLQLISSPPPVYPANARAQRVQGVVTLDALVDETGKVVEANIILGHPLLQDAAKAALHTWKYQPARLNGEVIPMRTRVSVRFSLN
jgi:TonB family protein